MISVSLERKNLNPLSANPQKWSDTLKQTHLLALKGLSHRKYVKKLENLLLKTLGNRFFEATGFVQY